MKNYSEDYNIVSRDSVKMSGIRDEISWLDDLASTRSGSRTADTSPAPPENSNPPPQVLDSRGIGTDQLSQSTNHSNTPQMDAPSQTDERENINNQETPSQMDEMERNNIAHERSASDICEDQPASVDGHSSSLIQQEEAAESPMDNPMDDMPQWNESTNFRRSGRRRTPTAKLRDNENDDLTLLRRAVGYLTSFITKTVDVKTTYNALRAKVSKEVDEHVKRLQMSDNTVELNVDGSLNYIHPMALTAKTGANATFHFHQAMQQPDRAEFIKE